MNFGRALRQARERQGISQRQLASTLNVSHSYVSHIEAGRRQPSIAVLARAADAVGLPLAVLALSAADDSELRGIDENQADRLAGLLRECFERSNPDTAGRK
ncbi:MAG: helix-turn-helix transcriptional regulator [Acidobacteria bacterium]|nr:helix-turn-helix transcriptional regulator [Acidobacteriota bacterium]